MKNKFFVWDFFNDSLETFPTLEDAQNHFNETKDEYLEFLNTHGFTDADGYAKEIESILIGQFTHKVSLEANATGIAAPQLKEVQ